MGGADVIGRAAKTWCAAVLFRDGGAVLVAPSAVGVSAGTVLTDRGLGGALGDGLFAMSFATARGTSGCTCAPAVRAVVPRVVEPACCVVELGCWVAGPGAVAAAPATPPATTAAPAMLVTTAALAPRATPLARTGRLVAGDVTMTGS
jgi:hypothetical protein